MKPAVTRRELAFGPGMREQNGPTSDLDRRVSGFRADCTQSRGQSSRFPVARVFAPLTVSFSRPTSSRIANSALPFLLRCVVPVLDGVGRQRAAAAGGGILRATF